MVAGKGAGRYSEPQERGRCCAAVSCSLFFSVALASGASLPTRTRGRRTVSLLRKENHAAGANTSHSGKTELAPVVEGSAEFFGPERLTHASLFSQRMDGWQVPDDVDNTGPEKNATMDAVSPNLTSLSRKPELTRTAVVQTHPLLYSGMSKPTGCKTLSLDMLASDWTLYFKLRINKQEDISNGMHYLWNQATWWAGVALSLSVRFFDGRLQVALRGNDPGVQEFHWFWESERLWNVAIEYSRGQSTLTLFIGGKPRETRKYYLTAGAHISDGEVGCTNGTKPLVANIRDFFFTNRLHQPPERWQSPLVPFSTTRSTLVYPQTQRPLSTTPDDFIVAARHRVQITPTTSIQPGTGAVE